MEGIFETVTISESEIPEIMLAYPVVEQRRRVIEWLRVRLQASDVEFKLVLGALRVKYKPGKLEEEY